MEQTRQSEGKAGREVSGGVADAEKMSPNRSPNRLRALGEDQHGNPTSCGRGRGRLRYPRRRICLVGNLQVEGTKGAH